jgi:predicted amidohydrolase
VFALKDAWGVKRLAPMRIQAVMTVRDGKIVYDALTPAITSSTQEIYDLLLKNGKVIDPANHRNGRFDIAISNRKIIRVAQNIPAAHARAVVDVSDYVVTPGLIDINTHFGANLNPDHNSLRNGVTTAVDAGNTSAKDFEAFKAKVIDHSKVRMLAFLKAGDDEAANGLMKKYPSLIIGMKASALEAPADVISSGIDPESVLLKHSNMMTAMAKSLKLGLSLDQAIERSTVNPARAIRRADLGTLKDGAPADIAILATDQQLRCVMTIRNGSVVWDSDGLAAPDVKTMGPYTNFK